MKNWTATLLGILFVFSGWSQGTETVNVKTWELAPGAWVLSGAGGNIGVIRHDSTTLVIDASYAPFYPAIDSAITAVSGSPVRYLLNTHYHPDHTGGNDSFALDGALIVAHSNVRQRLADGGHMEYFDRELSPRTGPALPVITFSESMQIYLGDLEVQLIHFPGGHTDGDAVVWIPGLNLLHAGDLIFSGTYPFIDVSGGGTSGGYIEALERLLELTNETTVIISGHGPVTNKAGMFRYYAMLRDVHNLILEVKKGDGSIEDALSSAEGFMKQYNDEYGDGFISYQDLITFMFERP